MHKILQRLRAQMPVPPASALGSGVSVNIVLKADQPTGKLTTGKIQDLLSRGDHPRGIKVRLQDGQIGRVQSLAASGSTTTSTAHYQDQPTSLNHSRQYHFQQDYRDTAELPSQERSLDDYTKVKPLKKKGKISKETSSSITEPESYAEEKMQVILQDEFPTLDSALIAAILNDSPDIENTRGILQALTTS